MVWVERPEDKGHHCELPDMKDPYNRVTSRTMDWMCTTEGCNRYWRVTRRIANPTVPFLFDFEWEEVTVK